MLICYDYERKHSARYFIDEIVDVRIASNQNILGMLAVNIKVQATSRCLLLNLATRVFFLEKFCEYPYFFRDNLLQ